MYNQEQIIDILQGLSFKYSEETIDREHIRHATQEVGIEGMVTIIMTLITSDDEETISQTQVALSKFYSLAFNHQINNPPISFKGVDKNGNIVTT